MDILQYVVSEGLVMIPVLFIIGEIIKKTESIENKWIPAILLVISLAFTPFVLGGFNADNLVQAVLVLGATVLGNELVKQGGK